MKFFLLLISMFYSAAFAGPVTSLAKETIFQDGPNCFNTSLYIQGFTPDITYSSDIELDFYLKNYCSQQPANAPLQAHDVVAFFDSEQVQHSAVSVQGNQIIEKNSLYGTLTPAFPEDPQPGQYLKRDISESLYAAAKSQDLFGTVFTRKSYRCLPAEKMVVEIQKLQKTAAVQEQLKFRKELAQAIQIADRRQLEAKILNHLVPMMKAMKWNKTRVANKHEALYLQTLLRSNSYQMHLLNCSDSMKKQGECWVPHLKASTEQTDNWLTEIIKFEEQHRL